MIPVGDRCAPAFNAVDSARGAWMTEAVPSALAYRTPRVVAVIPLGA